MNYKDLIVKSGPKVLLYRAGFLGDIVMSLAGCASIHEQVEDSTVVFLTWPMNIPMLEFHPAFDHVLQVGTIRYRDFDHIVDLRHDSDPWFSLERYWGSIHAEQIAKAVPGVKVPNDLRPSLFVGRDEYDQIVVSGKPVAVLNVWSQNGVNWRLWAKTNGTLQSVVQDTVVRWTTLAGKLIKMGYTVVQLGGKNDPPIGNVLPLLNLSLRQSIAIIAKASLAIGIDSFVMHCAGARVYLDDDGDKVSDGCKGVLLDGPIPSVCVIPDGSPVIAIEAAKHHCPDGKACGHSFATDELPICQYQNVCMSAIKVEEVLAAIEGLR